MAEEYMSKLEFMHQIAVAQGVTHCDFWAAWNEINSDPSFSAGSVPSKDDASIQYQRELALWGNDCTYLLISSISTPTTIRVIAKITLTCLIRVPPGWEFPRRCAKRRRGIDGEEKVDRSRVNAF
jgi:hypothetical protein